MATCNESEDELDSFDYAYEFERYEDGDIEDIDEDEDAVIDSGDADGECGDDGDLDRHGDDDWNFEGDDTSDDGGESKGGESKGVDSDDSDDDDGGVPSRRARGRCRPSHLLNVYLTRGGCCRNS